ncbi:MAG: helix-turn-helix domain-containing protein [Betaproteobacteria bacterium]|nr:MAG: helix-turn-helix domain-containing protein [Betaproteobacteria bacterium]
MPDSTELLLRTVAISLALVLALHGLALGRRPRLALLPLLACLASYLVCSAPGALCLSEAWLAPLLLASVMFPVAHWWLAHTAFADRNDVPWLARIGALVQLGGALALVSGWFPSVVCAGLHGLLHATGTAFVLVALWRIWSSRRGDLVAGRRALRFWLLGYVGLHGLAVLIVEWIYGATPAPAWLGVLNVALITTALGVVLAFLTQLRTTAIETLFGAEPQPQTAPVTIAPLSDEPWLDRLKTLMTSERVYLDPGLSLASLAQRLGLPEYRLRELINRRLGFRNFPSFVNHYRLEDVQGKLADPAFDRRPVLTLALEAGFGSIGPFNRAFRDRYGMKARRSGPRLSASRLRVAMRPRPAWLPVPRQMP